MLIMMFMLMMLMMMKLEQVPTFCTAKAWTLKQTSNRAARPMDGSFADCSADDNIRRHAECYKSQCRGQCFLLNVSMRNLSHGVRNVCRVLNLQTFCFTRC